MMKSLKSVFVLLLLILITQISFSQPISPGGADITASADVLSALSITKNTDIDFGNISQTTEGAVVLDPKGTAHAYVGETKTVGKFTIAAANSTSIEINWDNTLALDNGATGTMTLTFDVNGNSTDDASGSADLTSPADVTTSGTGAYYIYVGGSLGALSSQEVGSYTATQTFTVEYN